MKFISWNVNGIRSVQKKGFGAFLKKQPWDIICLQETRASQHESGLVMPGAYIYWNEAKKKGYSGTGIISKKKPLSVSYGLGLPEHDQEGRITQLEFKNYFLVNVYTPNSKRDLSRLTYRQQEWDKLFLKYLQTLERKKPVIFCGDLNVAHKEIDLARPKQNKRNAGFTDEERTGFDNYMKHGFIDTFREFCQDGGQYTWWSFMGNSRARNVGWRIDYFCVSQSMRSQLKDATILSKVMGSDHCPVTLELKR